LSDFEVCKALGLATVEDIQRSQAGEPPSGQPFRKGALDAECIDEVGMGGHGVIGYAGVSGDVLPDQGHEGVVPGLGDTRTGGAGGLGDMDSDVREDLWQLERVGWHDAEGGKEG